MVWLSSLPSPRDRGSLASETGPMAFESDTERDLGQGPPVLSTSPDSFFLPPCRCSHLSNSSLFCSTLHSAASCSSSASLLAFELWIAVAPLATAAVVPCAAAPRAVAALASVVVPCWPAVAGSRCQSGGLVCRTPGVALSRVLSCGVASPLPPCFFSLCSPVVAATCCPHSSSDACPPLGVSSCVGSPLCGISCLPPSYPGGTGLAPVGRPHLSTSPFRNLDLLVHGCWSHSQLPEWYATTPAAVQCLHCTLHSYLSASGANGPLRYEHLLFCGVSRGVFSGSLTLPPFPPFPPFAPCAPGGGGGGGGHGCCSAGICGAHP